MSLEIQPIDVADDAALGTCVEIVNSVMPEEPTSVQEIRWADRTYPGGIDFLANLDGVPVGAASTGRIYMYDASYERYWLRLAVLPDARRRGAGTALLAAVSRVARAAGKTGLQTSVRESHTDGLAFLQHRGFEVVERSKLVRLDLAGLDVPPVDLPSGIELTTLALRPDLVDGVYAVAREAYEDVPSAGQPITAGTLEEFLARDVTRDEIPADAFVVGVDAATGEVAGWASLFLIPGSTTRAWHNMTAVTRGWRGRGVATSLKRATIAWAIEHGLKTLETSNDEDNAPMRAVNARLGYRPTSDDLTLRGPLAPAPG